MRDRRVQGIQLVLHEEFPVRMLNDAMTDRHDLDLPFRRPVAHVVEGNARIAEKFRESGTVARKTRKHEAAVDFDPGRALHGAIGIRRVHSRPFISLRKRYPSNAAVEMKTPGVIRTNETRPRVSRHGAAKFHAAMRA